MCDSGRASLSVMEWRAPGSRDQMPQILGKNSHRASRSPLPTRQFPPCVSAMRACNVALTDTPVNYRVGKQTRQHSARVRGTSSFSGRRDSPGALRHKRCIGNAPEPMREMIAENAHSGVPESARKAAIMIAFTPIRSDSVP
ncbi:hypothetical protein KCP74_24885 [Salmonella enterica subsp. enterica]|nr:hypothetical protein KCP74_24885 [Salmonella enterica subsp. enterica]